MVRTRNNLPTGSFADLDVEGLDRGQFIVALARGLEVLRSFDPGEGPIGNQEIASKTGLPKATVSRITYTLSKLGYIEFLSKSSKYQLGSSVLALGSSFLSSLVIRQAARPHMQMLADELDASVALGLRERLAIAYVDLARGPGVLTLRLDVGARLPIHRSATGYAFLAGLAPVEREILSNALRKRHAEEWKEIEAQRDKAVGEIERVGFYIGRGTYERGINAVAAPFWTPDTQDFFVFNVTGPASEFPEERLQEEVGPKLLTMLENVRKDWRILMDR